MKLRKILALLLALCMATAMLTACGSSSGDTDQNKDSQTASDADQADADSDAVSDADSGEKRTAAFITIGDTEFFQNWIAKFDEMFQADGWETYSTVGGYDAEVQASAIENYVAMGVDVIIVFPLTGSALNSSVSDAMAAGSKTIVLVNATDEYDVCMQTDPNVLAEQQAQMAVEWVDEHFPDAEPGSVKCALLAYHGTPDANAYTETLSKIEDYSDKISLVTTYEIDEESIESGVAAAEDLAVTNPDLNLVVTASGDVALGFNNYYTSMNCPIDDLSDLGVFGINATDGTYAALIASANDEAIYRGCVVTGGIADTTAEMLEYANGLMDGTIEPMTLIMGKSIFVTAENAAEVREQNS